MRILKSKTSLFVELPINYLIKKLLHFIVKVIYLL